MTGSATRAPAGSTPWSRTVRRVDRFSLRMQARLDGDFADRVVPWAAAAVLFALFLALETAVIRSQEAGSGLAPWLQAAWRRQHSGVGSPVGGLDPATGSWSFVAEPVLFATRFASPTAVFAVVQALALALGVVPLWRLARRDADLRAGAAFTVVVAYALAPTLHWTNLTVFHPEVIALPALITAYRHALRGRWRAYAVFVALVLLCRADLGITVAALGLLLVREGRRRPGAITAAVGLAWSAAALIVLRPELPSGRLSPSGEYVARATTPLAVIPQLIAHPLTELRDLGAEPSVFFLVVVLAPLLFLPLVSARALWPAIPCLTLAMLADASVQRELQAGVLQVGPVGAHIAPGMAFVFVATVFALARIGRRSVTRINVDRRLLLALLAGTALLFLVEAPSSPYRTPWRWGSTDEVAAARTSAARLVGDTVPLAVSPQVAALVATRPRLVELPTRPTAIAPVPSDIDAIVVDTTGSKVAGILGWTSAQRRTALERLSDGGFDVVWQRSGVYVLRR
ncbi:MAG: putative rane protein [Acidimicrobiales bacterium]|nr:putative rane protein [Acidimicrobiales bacterium]